MRVTGKMTTFSCVVFGESTVLTWMIPDLWGYEWGGAEQIEPDLRLKHDENKLPTFAIPTCGLLSPRDNPNHMHLLYDLDQSHTPLT